MFSTLRQLAGRFRLGLMPASRLGSNISAKTAIRSIHTAAAEKPGLAYFAIPIGRVLLMACSTFTILLFLRESSELEDYKKYIDDRMRALLLEHKAKTQAAASTIK